MRLMRSILLHSFGWPQGILGRLGGVARMNADCGTSVTDLLEVRPNDKVLEVGFGPGVVIQRLARLANAGHVEGIDRSREMVGQARARNATAVQEGRVELRHGSVESLPFDDNRFDKALAINSMQYWPQAVAGLREVQRVMKADGRIALGFSPYSGHPNKGLPETLTAAGFKQAHVVESDKGFCALATK
jgi:ubiquinone/menaquinone biosynthesis C-methylase UbiE